VTTSTAGHMHAAWYCPPADAFVNILGIHLGLLIGLGSPCYLCP
jgi:hypothetical protein